MRLLYESDEIDNLFISKILGIKKSKLDSMLLLLSTIKDVDTNTKTSETRKKVKRTVTDPLHFIYEEEESDD
jgi:hypothetical protein